MGGGNPTGGNQTTTWTRTSSPAAVPVTADITVIAWVDASKITLPKPQTDALRNNLNRPGVCSILLSTWVLNQQTNLNGQADRDYANAWLLIHSANSSPPRSIDPNLEKDIGDFRLFNRFQIKSRGDISQPTAFPNEPPTVGSTADPCGTPVKQPGQDHPNNGFRGIDSAGQGVAQLVEGRLGTIGQTINTTINGGTTPWIWNVIEFDSTGSIVLPVDHAMFPTYSIYLNGSLVSTCSQSDPGSFIAQNSTYRRLPSDIPVKNGLTACHIETN